MPTAITTSTAPTATAYSNQRKLDRTSNGVLWAMYWDGTSNATSSVHFRCSTDSGATWTDGGGFGFSSTGTTYIPNGSLFIDLDDYAHAVYKDRNDGFIYYRRGTPNAARTAYAWTAATVVIASASYDTPDIVAHREGTGWKAHILLGNAAASTSTRTRYCPVDISSGGTVTVGAVVSIATSQVTSGPPAPSIDFNHTGDGKTVAAGAPHLYAVWTHAATGAGQGIRFKKATYSAGVWTWGADVGIDETSFANAGRISSAFDGTRVVVAYADSQATSSIKVCERNAADTTTTSRTPTALSDGVALGVSVSYNNVGDISLACIGTTSADPKWIKYARAAGTWGAWTPFAAATAPADTLTLQRGYGGGRTGALYADGAASPYNIVYDAISLNVAPNAPTLTSPANNATIDRGIVQRFAWTPSDPDAGDSQSKFDLRYRVVGNATWTTVSGTTPNAFWDAAAGTFATGNYEWQVATYDSQGAVGPWSASSFFTAADAPAQPTIIAPVSGGTVSNTQTVTWSAPNQTDYQIRRVADNAGNPNTGTVYYDSGDVVSSAARSQTLTFETNNRYEHIQVRIKYNGLWSSWASIRVQVSYTPPATPLLTFTPDATTGSLLVGITNPAPGSGVPATSYNDVYVDDGNGEERRVTMLAPNTSWTYWTPVALRDYAGKVRVVAVATNGTTSSS